jgi:two-component system, OmpR family, KDP operon response regulator KdpE
MSEKKGTILVVDDEPQLRKLMIITLESEGFKVVDSDCGKQAIRLAASVKPELVVLDLGLPDIDGKEVVTSLREWTQIPIIICSVRNDDEEVIAALDLGADDYVTKPFNPEVLIARVNANLRKAATKEAGEPNLTNGQVKIDLVRHEVFLGGNKVSFSPKEYDLLKYFMINRGKMLTHKQILKEVWGPAHEENMQYLRVYVGQIREKLNSNDIRDEEYIITEPGIGYRMETVK